MINALSKQVIFLEDFNLKQTIWMCQTEQIWSNTCQYNQRFQTVLCKPIRAKQAYV